MVARDTLRVFQAGRFENKFQMLFGGYTREWNTNVACFYGVLLSFISYIFPSFY